MSPPPPFPNPHSNKSRLQLSTDWLVATSVTQTARENEFSANPRAGGRIVGTNQRSGGGIYPNTIGVGEKRKKKRRKKKGGKKNHTHTSVPVANCSDSDSGLF